MWGAVVSTHRPVSLSDSLSMLRLLYATVAYRCRISGAEPRCLHAAAHTVRALAPRRSIGGLPLALARTCVAARVLAQGPRVLLSIDRAFQNVFCSAQLIKELEP